MKILIGQDAVVAKYIADATGDQLHAPMRTIGIYGPKGLVGAYAVDRWTGFGAEVSGAGRGIMLRAARQAVGDLVFGFLGCRRMEIHVRQSNKAMKQMAPRLGFVFEGKLRKYFGNEDGLCYSLLSEEAVALGHWMPMKKAA